MSHSEVLVAATVGRCVPGMPVRPDVPGLERWSGWPPPPRCWWVAPSQSPHRRTAKRLQPPSRQPSSAAKPVPAESVSSSVREDRPGAKPAQAFAAANPDPVCVRWQRVSAGYDGKQQAWAKTDHRVAAARWSPKQRSVTMAVIPVMRQEAVELRRLADESNDPLLAGLMRAQSRYVDNYAAKLPKFEPADHASWTAATAMDGAVKAVCSTPR